VIDIPPKDPDDFELIDFEQLKNWIRFTRHAVWRRKLLALAVALVTMGAALALLSVMPRTYRIEAQLLAQRNSVMASLGNPSRRVPFEADSPTRAAAETVLRRDNLLSLMKQTDLLNHWYTHRTWLFRLKDRLVELIAAPTEEERTQAMVEFLESRLTVKAAEPTVTITLEWPDAQLGFRLVDTALQNFLEQRHSTEVSTIAETISILEGHANNLKEAIDAEMQDVKQPVQTPPVEAGNGPPAPPRRDLVAEANKAELAEVKVMLDAKRRAINELDEFRNRRLLDLQAQLAQQRAVYADAHPAILTLQQSISALQEPSPQLLSLRKEERELQAEYDKLSARRAEGAATVTKARSGQASTPRAGDKRSEDLNAEYARTRLRFAMEKYDVLLERIEAARIELDTARAAFKYRYSVVRPPTFPRRPEKPKVPLVMAGALVVALLLGTLAAVVADVWSGKILELWQMERGLKLPVLGQIPRP
jgi:uncharacterized protein involved in exopolysaccharide biosynthesis